MKKRVLIRIIGIGAFHSVLYVYVVPFIIYPTFGQNGLIFAVIVATIISIAILGTVYTGKKK